MLAGVSGRSDQAFKAPEERRWYTAAQVRAGFDREHPARYPGWQGTDQRVEVTLGEQVEVDVEEARLREHHLR
ncbi:MAG: hypothetical protein Q8S73_12065 [Deltaproteobacteria bacterium]|nr:hypothetical protein [Myxococcales bacterium]MDP3214834.1 hypothetical protein [Deltaproteobacteria bacterium]